jgi:hypothetical protein
LTITVYGATHCSHCQARLDYTKKRFGPPILVCWKCNEKIATGDTEWAQFSGPGKAWLATQEILLPSFIAIPGRVQRILFLPLVALLLWLVCAMPFMLPWLTLDGQLSAQPPVVQALVEGLAILGLCVYPALMLWRLSKMVAQSNAYTESGAIPVTHEWHQAHGPVVGGRPLW